jgi:hypothetical protein
MWVSESLTGQSPINVGSSTGERPTLGRVALNVGWWEPPRGVAVGRPRTCQCWAALLYGHMME